MKASEALKRIGKGRVATEGEFQVLGKLNAIEVEGTLAFISDSKYLDKLSNKKVSAVITTESLAREIVGTRDIAVIVEESPKEAFYLLHNDLFRTGYYVRKVKTRVGNCCEISESSSIATENVLIGDNCIIQEKVIIKSNVSIGDNVVISSGTVLGAEGFEPIRIANKWQIAPHAGSVMIGSDVFIEANNCLSKGLFPSRNTVIGDQVLTDNLVHIAHGVWIGAGTRIAASAMIAGSVTIGKNVWIGPGALISNGITIFDDARITIGAVVTKNVEAGSTVSGNFAIDHQKFLSFLKTIR